ncbi:hypothetical protein AS4_19250 [Acinetobacter guillouiae]|jgi:hypothetical protein|nr:hypothetical protein AS4_19250 [Acinetobacter guillouiae]
MHMFLYLRQQNHVLEPFLTSLYKIDAIPLPYYINHSNIILAIIFK